mmetsp:Transcript_10074/g.18168  ORF Transcript_10074/g.18168 Transcript_10074/m.18168 type:complete len:174 (-) Transcript_10074:301-822(-)|eukprot:CAMPEP_0177771902 /NCGR_PEP_ID=MMETSP0491_2-20121128/11892_1 /TAXON_ID=63592 /ORGANISM="Tetraselmis chuii, Strain PLY429" /LENGTH=173 /DNA_ID=CAMNT_0019289587 /DNA_START=115 /DNA_END=636 /DNA_ORIENTATION=+
MPAELCTAAVADVTINSSSLAAVRQQAAMLRGVAQHAKQCRQEGCGGTIQETVTRESRTFRSCFWLSWPLHCFCATSKWAENPLLCNPVQGCIMDLRGATGPAKLTRGVCDTCGDESEWIYAGDPWGKVTMARPFQQRPADWAYLWACCPRRLIKEIPGLTERIRVSSDPAGF